MEDTHPLPLRGTKRRKVRKGTRSCWECRRRKIRCVYPSDDALTCSNCESRGTDCLSQEFSDEKEPAPDRRVTQRLGRVEEMLEKLVEKIMPESHLVGRRGPASSSSASADHAEPALVENACPFSVGKPPMFGMLETLRDGCNKHTTGYESASIEPNSHCEAVLGTRHARISEELHDLFPCQEDIDTIVAASPGSTFIGSFFSRYRDLVDGRTEPPSSISIVPPASSHPVILARRLMQLTNCLQQIPPDTPIKLASRTSARCLMGKFYSTVTDLVVYNDDLAGSVEGIETIALVALYHSNVGNLRKAWLILRRALSVAQLMGIDRWGDKPLKSADPLSNPLILTKAKPLWFRLNFIDRYLSLLLGLPAGTDDNSFVTNDPQDEPTDRLEKQHTVVMGAIIKRNSSKGDPAFDTTQTIDCDLETAAKSVGPEFWKIPSSGTLKDDKPVERMRAMSQLMMQMNHHNLLILLHLPYMLRDPKERRWDYSKAACINSSRKLLHSFLVFRKSTTSSFTCRHTDYGALTASMTLLLGYLDPKLQARDPATTLKREADRVLIQECQDKMQAMADDYGDKLSRDASTVIGRLLPLLSPELTGGGNEGVGELPTIHLEIPYLGTININPSSAHPHTPHHDVHPPHAHGSPAITVNTTTTATATATTAKTTPASDSLSQEDYAGFARSSTFSQNAQPSMMEWGTPSGRQQFTNVGGGQGAEGSFPLSFPMGHENDSNGFADLNGFAPMMQFEWSHAQLAHPELAADADQWTFQGFDTAYFESLFSSGLYGS